jgi:hypothetical protein
MPQTQLHYLAIGGAPPHFDLLTDSVVQKWKDLENFVSSHWTEGTDKDRERLRRVSACLEKLGTTLLQADRLRRHHSDLLNAAQQFSGGGAGHAAFKGATACSDFESLLLQGRAALDRLTWFIAGEFGQTCSSFRKLRNILVNFEKKDAAARQIIEIIDVSATWIDGLLATIETDQSLRDFVAHKGAIIERVSNCFGITFLAQNRALVLDCELMPFPVFRTTTEAVQHLSHLILNSLAVATSNQPLEFETYACQWRNQTVVFSEFVLDEPGKSPLTEHALTVVRRMTPVGFESSTRNVDPKIYEYAIEFNKDQAG